MNKQIRIMEEKEKEVIVTLLEANHCPGAALLLFRVDGVYHLHTGDMRYSSAMKLYSELQNIQIQNLYLDTTYCSHDYDFPPQSDAIDQMISIMHDEV